MIGSSSMGVPVRFGRLVSATLVLFIVAVAWNGVLHMLILREANALVTPLRRANLSDLMWLSLLMTLGLSALFAFGYACVARTGRLLEGIGYGVFFALLAGLLVDLNQYMMYPIPGKVAFYWFIGGLLEFSLYGALMTRLYPIAAKSG